MKTNISFLPAILLSAFAAFSQQQMPQLQPAFVKSQSPVAFYYADYLPASDPHIDSRMHPLKKFGDHSSYYTAMKSLSQAIMDYIVLKGSIDMAKTKYRDDNYKRDPFAKFDIEAIIALAEELLPNPWDTKGENLFLNVEDADKSKNFLQLRTGLRFHGRGDVQKADNGDTYKTSVYYLALPLYLLYNHRAANNNDRFFAGLGPYYGYALFGKFIDKVNGETIKEKIKFGKDQSGLKHGDFGLGLVAGYIYGQILLQLSYDMGLSNITFDKEAKAFNRAFGFSVGYVLH